MEKKTFPKPNKEESLPPNETGVDISEKRYKKIAETFGMIVKEVSNLSVPEKTIKEWEIFSSSTRIVDNKLDGIVDPMERLEFAREIIGFLRGETVDFSNDEDMTRAMSGVKNLIANLEKNQKESFVNSLSSILKITEKIKNERDPRKIVKLTRVEGQIAARFYLLLLPQEFRLSEKYKKLMLIFTRLGRAANSLDSFIDLPDDYHNKEIQIPPTILNRTLFFGAVLSDGLSMMKNLGLSKDLIKRFLLATKHVALDSPKKSE